MIDFIVWLNSNRNKRKFLEVIQFYRFKIHLSIFLEKYFLKFYLKCSVKNFKNTNKYKEDLIVVSLTSFPKRINTVWITIESILRQSLRPDILVLWLSKDQFESKASLPKKLLNLEKRGLTIKFVDGNLKSYKKFYYALQEYPNAYIVTIDDDLIYHSSLIESLYNKSKNDKCVVCNWCRYITKNDENILSYNNWNIINHINNIEDEHNIFLLSGGGTIFPPNSLYKDVLNVDLFTRLTPSADDIWLNTMCRMQNTKIHFLNSNYTFKGISIKDNETLWSKNLSQNDIQLKSVCAYYQKQIF